MSAVMLRRSDQSLSKVLGLPVGGKGGLALSFSSFGKGIERESERICSSFLSARKGRPRKGRSEKQSFFPPLQRRSPPFLSLSKEKQQKSSSSPSLLLLPVASPTNLRSLGSAHGVGFSLSAPSAVCSAFSSFLSPPPPPALPSTPSLAVCQ